MRSCSYSLSSDDSAISAEERLRLVGVRVDDVDAAEDVVGQDVLGTSRGGDAAAGRGPRAAVASEPPAAAGPSELRVGARVRRPAPIAGPCHAP